MRLRSTPSLAHGHFAGMHGVVPRGHEPVLLSGTGRAPAPHAVPSPALDARLDRHECEFLPPHGPEVCTYPYMASLSLLRASLTEEPMLGGMVFVWAVCGY